MTTPTTRPAPRRLGRTLATAAAALAVGATLAVASPAPDAEAAQYTFATEKACRTHQTAMWNQYQSAGVGVGMSVCHHYRSAGPTKPGYWTYVLWTA